MRNKQQPTVCILWFRNNFRLLDNPILNHISYSGKYSNLIPLAIIPDQYMDPDLLSANRLNFYLEALNDLNKNLQAKFKQKLIILEGKYFESIVYIINFVQKQFSIPPENITLAWELCLKSEFKTIDNKLKVHCQNNSLSIINKGYSTLWPISSILQITDHKPPSNMSSFIEDLKQLPEPEKPLKIPKNIPPLLKDFLFYFISNNSDFNEKNNSIRINLSENVNYYFDPPSLKSYEKYFSQNNITTSFEGGETKALEIFNHYLQKSDNIFNFNKNKQNPVLIKPSSTTLSPYINLGCVSVRYFYFRVKQIYKIHQIKYKPENTIIGQLCWREFFYVMDTFQDDSTKLEKQNKKEITQISQLDKFYISVWENGKTGYPAIGSFYLKVISRR